MLIVDGGLEEQRIAILIRLLPGPEVDLQYYIAISSSAITSTDHIGVLPAADRARDTSRACTSMVLLALTISAIPSVDSRVSLSCCVAFFGTAHLNTFPAVPCSMSELEFNKQMTHDTQHGGLIYQPGRTRGHASLRSRKLPTLSSCMIAAEDAQERTAALARFACVTRVCQLVPRSATNMAVTVITGRSYMHITRQCTSTVRVVRALRSRCC